MEKGRVISLGGPWVLAQWGPMTMKVGAWKGRSLAPELAERGARCALQRLQEVADHLPLLRVKARRLKVTPNLPQVVAAMIEAAQRVGDPDLTPLSAVAGAIAEGVAEATASQGADRVVVENGGDIALHLEDGQQIEVGVRPRVGDGRVMFKLRLKGSMGLRGVATSGLGGRSLTKGVAEAAVVLASRASVADAAATAVANATSIDSAAVRRLLAEELDPGTDLQGEWVTAEVGPLSPEEKEEALQRGLLRAEELRRRGLIWGALLHLQGGLRWTEGMEEILQAI